MDRSERGSGILLHISSLPSKYGIGTFGEAASRFVDFLAASGQRYWQVLPMGMTGYGNSPYQSCSAFAGNINFIDLDILAQQGFLKDDDYRNIAWGCCGARVDYNKIYQNRSGVLKRAAKGFQADNTYRDFCEENRLWLDNFALFMAIKERHGMQSFGEWDKGLKLREPEALKAFRDRNQANIVFYKITQFWFYNQLGALRQYAREKGIRIIGDIPFYVAYDSADVWANPQMFELDENLRPKNVAGVPPDAFSNDGQFWGNPLYDYAAMRADGYAWWRRRIRQSFLHCDILRIDHFRAIDSYYAVAYSNPNARTGQWRTGEGMAFINALGLMDMHIIAEDLGDLSDSVRALIRQTCFPNMKVLQFAFDSDKSNEFLTNNYKTNCVVYTGTHDNNTVKGWYKALPLKQKLSVARYVPYSLLMSKSKALIRYAQRSVASIAIIPMQDYLELDESARMNMPSTVNGNWEWRAVTEDFTPKMIQHIKKLSDLRLRPIK